MHKVVGALLASVLAGAACSASASPAVSPTGSAPPSAAVSSSATATSAPPTASPATATPSPSAAPTAQPSLYQAASLPVRVQLLPPQFLRLAPSPDGALYVLIPNKAGAVLVRLDRNGAVAHGWPVTLPHTTACSFVAAAADGSVRAICDATDITQPQWCCDTDRAFALDAAGRPLAGWPVPIIAAAASRVNGTDLVILVNMPVTDAVSIGHAASRVHLARIGPDGGVASGVEVLLDYRGGGEVWSVGPDSVAYATSLVIEAAEGQPMLPDQLLAVDGRGVVSGWPVTLTSGGSPLAITDRGRLALLAGSRPQGPSGPSSPVRVMAFDPAQPSKVLTSQALPIEIGYDSDCGDSALERAPLAGGGVTVVRDGMTFYALDANLQSLPGWPYRATGYLQEWVYPPSGNEEGGLSCGIYAEPVLGPDGTLYVPVDAGRTSNGGSLVAVGRDGRVATGWPVTLRSAGSGFWAVVAGQNGSAYAAAVEKESRGLSSTVLAIAPGGTVTWKATVVEP